MAMLPPVLILAAHGSPHERARDALAAFARRASLMHPGARVLLAHTAKPRPGSHPGSSGPCLEEVLRTLSETPVALGVQSLHVIAGSEFDRMRAMVEAFAGRTGSEVAVAGPLLSRPADAPRVAQALAESLAEPAAGEAHVLMGHGTTHAAQELYSILAGSLAARLPLARLGVLEAADPDDPLSIRAISRDLADAGVRRARLVPFLTVAGRHAHKDLAGDQPGSWKSILAESAIAGIPDLAGLVERERFARLWLAGIGGLLKD